MSSEAIHTLNIIIHVVSGSVAILGGFIVLARRKGDQRHRFGGRIVVGIIMITVASALFGALMFRARPDLIGISILVAYQLWSGVRALHLKDNGRRLLDFIPALMMLMGGVAMLILSGSGASFFWESALVKAVIGAMLVYGGYDVVKVILPRHWRVWLNPAEHAYKMSGLIGVLITVALATLLKDQVALTAIAASGVASVAALVFAVRAAMRARRYALGVTSSSARNARLKADSEL